MDQAQLNWITHFIWDIADAIARTEREIALMQEYRTRLTADLVTGKLDVRDAAAKLPEAVAFPSDLPDPSDESDLAEETTAEEES